MQISNILYSDKPSITVSFKDDQMQSGFLFCGLFAIVFTTALIFGGQSGQFMLKQRPMRFHLIQSLESCSMSIFPVIRFRHVTGKIKPTDEVDVYCICRISEFTKSQWIHCLASKEWYHSKICVWKIFNSKLAWYCFRCNNNYKIYFYNYRIYKIIKVTLLYKTLLGYPHQNQSMHFWLT